MAESTIIAAGYVLPGPDSGSLVADGAVAVSGSRILAVGSRSDVTSRWPRARVTSYPDCLLMPGLVNAHQHGRGLSQIQLGFHDDFLEPWIAGRRARGVLDAYAVTALAAARMLANGVTTTVHANYSYGTGDYERELREQIRAYDEVGIRATLSVGAMDRGGTVYPPHESCFLNGLDAELQGWLSKPASAAYAGDGAATIALMARLRSELAGHPRIRLCYGPAGPQWVSDGLWRILARDARDHDLGLHLHALESPAQRLAARELYPGGVFQHLDMLGAMTPRTVVAHGVWAEKRDMDVLARTGATVVRNPGCNLRMRNGIAPMALYLHEGVRVAIGTDNCSLDDEEDLLAELRLAGALAREADWKGVPPPTIDQLLAMATMNGAVAAQFAGEIGRLEPGLHADMAAFSLDRTRQPYLDADMPLLEAFFARGRGADARMTMVDGRVLYENGRYMVARIADLESRAAEVARAARLPADAANVGRTALLRDHMCAHYRTLSDRIDEE